MAGSRIRLIAKQHQQVGPMLALKLFREHLCRGVAIENPAIVQDNDGEREVVNDGV